MGSSQHPSKERLWLQLLCVYPALGCGLCSQRSPGKMRFGKGKCCCLQLPQVRCLHSSPLPSQGLVYSGPASGNFLQLLLQGESEAVRHHSPAAAAHSPSSQCCRAASAVPQGWRALPCLHLPGSCSACCGCTSRAPPSQSCCVEPAQGVGCAARLVPGSVCFLSCGFQVLSHQGLA